MAQLTPMLRQYTGIKAEYPDAILFFRMGDFYEMFFDDARTASRILGITLTSRGSHNGEKVPMCGVPHHASKTYIGKLVSHGWKVAICEQTEDPKSSKGIVRREVVRLVTPGSLVDADDLDKKQNLYMAAICGGTGNFGLAYVDLSTGEFWLTQRGSRSELMDELGRVEPAELLVPEGGNFLEDRDLSHYRMEQMADPMFDNRRAERLLKEQLGVKSLDAYGIQDLPEGVNAAGALVQYLLDTQKGNPEHIKAITPYRVGDYMILDEATCAHLELLKTMRRQSTKGSLVQVLDKTVTPMGSRLLKRWIAYPLVGLDDIRGRLAAVAWFKDEISTRQKVREQLDEVYDLERLSASIAMGRANARDLLALKISIGKLPVIKRALEGAASERLSEIADSLDTLDDIGAWIEEAVHEDPPVSIKEGRIIKLGYDSELDRLVSLTRDGKSWIAQFESSEQKRTGIPRLKVGYNKVFGYYIEVSKANLHLVPPDYTRKQTLVNGERYVTDSLKNMEEQVLGAEEQRILLEYEIFDRVRRRIAGQNQRIKGAAERIAQIDGLNGLAEVAESNNYARPAVNDSCDIEIEEGRHPVIEQTVTDEEFVPNDICLNAEDQNLLIITGPNMAGKSTILRQTALTVLMAQMGSFVPAARATIGIVDRIFTRVGASDDLAKGQSTFMVEMTETANILRHATPKSLVVLDEVGRGTSTYDGLSIAWAVAEALHDVGTVGVRTLFATHYHELTELAATKNRVKNFNVAVREWNDQIIFLRKMVPGGTSRSYGIQVARIAGLPENVLSRAGEILDNLEGGELDEMGVPRLAKTHLPENKAKEIQLGLFGARDERLRDWVRKLDIDSITPLEALVQLSKLKEYVDETG
jgi:DNA mismatch repair protein MutS